MLGPNSIRSLADLAQRAAKHLLADEERAHFSAPESTFFYLCTSPVAISSARSSYSLPTTFSTSPSRRSLLAYGCLLSNLYGWTSVNLFETCLFETDASCPTFSKPVQPDQT